MARSTSPEAEKDLLREAKERLMRAHQPAAYAALSGFVSDSLERARTQGAFMMISPGADAPPALAAPISILASVMRSEPGATLDAQISRAIEERGARPLDRSAHFLRWIDRRTVDLGGESAQADTIVYVTPVPNTDRSRALRLTATIAYPVGVDADNDATVAAWTSLVDSHIATFTWENNA